MLNRSFIICISLLILNFGIQMISYPQTNHSFQNDNKIDTVKNIVNNHFQNNRQILKLPWPKYMVNDSGIVAIKVWINKNGIVTKAQLDSTNTTATDVSLLKSSLKAANKALFNRIEKDTIKVERITYKFTIQ